MKVLYNLLRKPSSYESGSSDGVDLRTYWFNDGHCIRLADIPGTLSADILRLEKHPLAELRGGSYDIDGDIVRPLETEPVIPQYDDDSEDVSDALAQLPIVEEPDPSKFPSQ